MAAVARDGAFREVAAIAGDDQSADVRHLAAQALGQTDDEGLEEVLRVAKAASPQDMIWFLAGAAGNPGRPKRMWEFVVENWEWIVDVFGEVVFAMPTIIGHGTARMTTEDDACALERFIAEHPCDIADRPIRQAVERIRTDARLISREGKAVAEFVARLEGASDRMEGHG
jgi:hypothetical protein